MQEEVWRDISEVWKTDRAGQRFPEGRCRSSRGLQKVQNGPHERRAALRNSVQNQKLSSILDLERRLSAISKCKYLFGFGKPYTFVALVIFRAELHHFWVKKQENLGCFSNLSEFVSAEQVKWERKWSSEATPIQPRHKGFTINILSFIVCVFASFFIYNWGKFNNKMKLWKVKKNNRFTLAFKFWLVFFGTNIWNISGFSAIMIWTVRYHQIDSLTSEDASMPAWDMSSATFFSKSFMRRPIWSSVPDRKSSAWYFSGLAPVKLMFVWFSQSQKEKVFYFEKQQLLFYFEGASVSPQVKIKYKLFSLNKKI